MGIADHAKKTEKSSILAENQLLKCVLKEFEGTLYIYFLITRLILAVKDSCITLHTTFQKVYEYLKMSKSHLFRM